MDLAEWMEKKNISDMDISDMVGCKKQIVKLWREKINSPRLLHAIKLRELTKNKVSLTDLLSKEDKVKHDQENQNKWLWMPAYYMPN